MKVALLTLGCRTNQAESLRIERQLQEEGHDLVHLSQEPDICILNTCSVTSKADYQSRQLIQRAHRVAARVIVTGCYAELNQERLAQGTIPLEIIDNSHKHCIINMLSSQSSCSTSRQYHPSRTRPIIKVQDGCDQSCSYCIIPKARGRSRSIEPEAVLQEARLYDDLGCPELVLSGIHLGTYGLDLQPRRTLANLLEGMLARTRIPRLRLSSLELTEIDEDLLGLLSDPRVCNHLHIPLQSGDDGILRVMNRSYTVSEYLSGIERILTRLPQIALGTDIIVGFPGEGQEEFLRTRGTIQSLPLSYIHVFPYSPRPATKAYDLPNRVPDALKKHRVDQLREIASNKRTRYLQDHLGRTLDTVVERKGPEGFIGTTRNYIRVLLPGGAGLTVGRLINAHLIGYEKGVALGVPVKTQEALQK